MTPIEAQNEAMKNDLLIRLDDNADNIERIATEGSSQPQDHDIIEMCLWFALGVVHQRRHESTQLEEGDC